VWNGGDPQQPDGNINRVEPGTVTPNPPKAELAILRVLDDAASDSDEPRMTVVSMAGAVRLTQATTRHYLAQMTESGYVQREPMTVPGKPNLHGYSITPMGSEYLDRLLQGEP
jgi:DNA-binding PadR family transcriptional regulator